MGRAPRALAPGARVRWGLGGTVDRCEEAAVVIKGEWWRMRTPDTGRVRGWDRRRKLNNNVETGRDTLRVLTGGTRQDLSGVRLAQACMVAPNAG